MELAVIGTGYVGLVAGVGFADAGHKVYCVDRDAVKIEALKVGRIPIYEPGLEDLLIRNRTRLVFTTQLEEAVKQTNILFIAVGTPETADGSADLEPLFAAIAAIARCAEAPKTLVIKSTVPIGTARRVVALIKEITQIPIDVISNPEFLREGAAIDDFLTPDRVVIGCRTEQAQLLMTELYRPFALQQGRPIFFMDNTSAEMTKYAANAFLSVKISFINELALLADQMGADIDQVKAGFTSDHRINPSFFNPGVGFGGSCFPKDVKALMHTGVEHGVAMSVVSAADQVNDRQKLVLFNRVSEYFNHNLAGKRIALWGLSFKPQTDDVREAPALSLMHEFHKAGAELVAFDPVATETARKATAVPFKTAPTAMECVQAADALVIVTEWNEFRNPDLNQLKDALKQPVIFDGRNIFDPKKLRAAGFDYFCIGRQAVANFEEDL